MEQLLFKACAGQSYEEELDVVYKFFYDDFNREELVAELPILYELYQSAVQNATPSAESIKNALLTISSSQRMMLSNVCRLFQLLLILPATNATSERSFSALRRIKSYLRSTMTQARLNHLMLLHYHQDITDQLDLRANEYKTDHICNF